jgi:hypothetical protein
MAPQASEKRGLLPPDHQQIGCCTSNSLDSEQVFDAFVCTHNLIAFFTS